MIFSNIYLMVFCLVTYTNQIMVLAILTQQNTPENTTQLNSYRKVSRVQHSRTLQRLVGGHRQNIQNPFVQKQLSHDSTLKQNSKIYFRRKVLQPTLETDKNSVNNTLSITTSGEVPYQNISSYDTAEWDGLDNNSIESLDYSASSRTKKENVGDERQKEESKKTLADQVAEGKYGLIQKELFEKEPKRLGVLSYSTNSEVSKDNPNNLGGLKEEEIWLAEDHLLVLAGGSLNTMQKEEPWKPISNYEAPKRPVVLPLNPKVPPPFPVQLTENGPIQFIGNSQFSVFNPITNESIIFSKEGFSKVQAHGNDQKNSSPGYPPAQNPSNPYGYPPHPYPPPTFSLPPLNGRSNQTLVNPFFDPNQPESFDDEDDPSLYYPPPYSFSYKSNYTNDVAPGPLVPGVILPPPPSFFKQMGKINKTVKSDRDKEYKTTTTTSTTTTTTTTPPSVAIEITQEKVVSVGNKFYKEDVNKYLFPTKCTTTTAATTTTNVKPSKPMTLRTQSFIRDKDRPVLQVPVKQYTNILEPTAILGDGKKPVYFEYFDARTTNKPFEVYGLPNYQTIPVTPTPAPQRIMLKPKSTTKPSIKYLPVEENMNYDKFLYITPKPVTVKPMNDALPFVTAQPHQQSFNYEVKSIKNTLTYFRNRQENNFRNVEPQLTQIQRTPKAKAVYEYSFDATNNGQSQNRFVPPTQMDTTPFRPIVQYNQQITFPDSYSNQPLYYTTPTPFLINNQPTTKGYGSLTHPAYLYYSVTPKAALSQERPEYSTINYSTKSALRQEPWLSIEQQVFREILRRPISQRTQLYKNYRPLPNYNDQYNNQPYQPYPNDQHYYQLRDPINQNPREAYKPEIMQNSTFFSYRNIKQPIMSSNVQQKPQRYNGPHQQTDYSYDYVYQNQKNQPTASWPPPALHKDILVNYKYPLPPINPDAELLPMPL